MCNFKPGDKQPPWYLGRDGWDNYIDFLSWLRKEINDDDYDDWIDESPTILMKVFYRLWSRVNEKRDRRSTVN